MAKRTHHGEAGNPAISVSLSNFKTGGFASPPSGGFAHYIPKPVNLGMATVCNVSALSNVSPNSDLEAVRNLSAWTNGMRGI
jgi:hypothetical protein